MHDNRKIARQWLNEATRNEFYQILHDAKISDDDMTILDLKFIHGYSNVRTALEANVSIDQVNYTVKRVYDKIARLLR